MVKPLSDFYQAAGMRDGHRNDCKACNLKVQAARIQANPEANRRRAKEWRLDNPERAARRDEHYRATGRKRISDRKSYLKRKFGITPERYDAMLAAQGGVCAICGRPPNSGAALHIDHDHRTNRIRGILCFRCNNALGDLDDDPDRLMAAAMYLLSAAHDSVIHARAALAGEEERQLPLFVADE